METYLVLAALWIVGIPIALGWTLRGWWPPTADAFWISDGAPWVQGILWPYFLALWILWCTVRVLWWMVVLILRALFRFGSWVRG